MASIRRQITLETSPDEAWDALRDWGRLHERLAPGFVTNVRLDGPDRLVTFFNGNEVREVLVTCDDDARLLVWTIVGGPYSHHNGMAQVVARDGGGCEFSWSTDLLPDEAAEPTAAMMDQGLAAIRRHLDAT
jgi:hypothetical protein